MHDPEFPVASTWLRHIGGAPPSLARIPDTRSLRRRPRLGLGHPPHRRQSPIKHLESNTVRATLTRYSVPGWGDGDLWTLGRVVLAHDFSYLDRRGTGAAGDGDNSVSARPLEGAASPPSGAVSAKRSHVGHVTAPSWRQENGSHADAAARELVARLAGYLAGTRVRLDDVELDFSWATPFQRAVADALRRIPRGEVVSYGELAALAGYPGAARAVGTFCAHNRFALLVPCHRVVAAGGIGGYGATGLAVKRRLLALEGVVL